MKLISLTRFQTSAVERDFLKSINRALHNFDESRARLVFSKFEIDHNLSKDDIFDNPELFSKTLRNIFRFGSSYVEKAMIAELREDFSLPEREYKGLADTVAEIRESLS